MRARAPGRTWEIVTLPFALCRARRRTTTAAVLIVMALAPLAGGQQPTRPAAAAANPDPGVVLTAVDDDTAELTRLQQDLHRASRDQARQQAAVPTATPTLPAPAVPAARRAERTAPRSPAPRTQRPAPVAAPADSSRAATVIAFALAQVGKRYVLNTAGPNTWDCSGLVMVAFAQVGIRLPHASGGIAARGQAVPRGQWVPGDVLVYPGHVAIYLGGGQMVAAANPRDGVTRSSVYGSPSARRLL